MTPQNLGPLNLTVIRDQEYTDQDGESSQLISIHDDAPVVQTSISMDDDVSIDNNNDSGNTDPSPITLRHTSTFVLLRF